MANTQAGQKIAQASKFVAGKTVSASASVQGAAYGVGEKVGAKLANEEMKEMVTLYRGVNEANVGYEDATRGVVKPNGGTATAEMHNAGATQNSPYSSWTTDKKVATNYALRGGENGVVLETQVPLPKQVTSPSLKNVVLKQSKEIVNESEVLLKGTIRNAKVTSINQIRH